MANNPEQVKGPLPHDDSWDVFEVDDFVETEPEQGDFWGELDDDYDNRG
jgi:hypothetical protein